MFFCMDRSELLYACSSKMINQINKFYLFNKKFYVRSLILAGWRTGQVFPEQYVPRLIIRPLHLQLYKFFLFLIFGWSYVTIFLISMRESLHLWLKCLCLSLHYEFDNCPSNELVVSRWTLGWWRTSVYCFFMLVSSPVIEDRNIFICIYSDSTHCTLTHLHLVLVG